jgi:hypothetical protein
MLSPRSFANDAFCPRHLIQTELRFFFSWRPQKNGLNIHTPKQMVETCIRRHEIKWNRYTPPELSGNVSADFSAVTAGGLVGWHKRATQAFAAKIHTVHMIYMNHYDVGYTSSINAVRGWCTRSCLACAAWRVRGGCARS